MPLNEFEELKERDDLLERQARLVDAVLTAPPDDADAAPGAALPEGLRALPGLPGGLPQALEAYRASACLLAERALAVVYPRLREWMEAERAGSFVSLAWHCWRHHEPVEGDLGEWGEAVIAELSAAEAGSLPSAWTALARIEWDLHRVERRADPEQDLGSLALLGRLPAGAVRLVLADHVSLHRCDAPALRQVRELPTESFGAGPRAAMIVWRDGWSGQTMAIDAAVLRWCEALREGLDLERALLQAGVAFDFSAWLPAAVARGWLARVETVEMAVPPAAAKPGVGAGPKTGQGPLRPGPLGLTPWDGR